MASPGNKARGVGRALGTGFTPLLLQLLVLHLAERNAWVLGTIVN